MDTSYQSLPLLGSDDSFDEKQFCNGGLERSFESSSGYESSDNSDADYDVTPMVASHAHTARATAPASTRFQSTHTLCEDLALLLDIPEMCDVTFHVGNAGTPVHGVRAILATRSKVFYQLILRQIQIRDMLYQKARKHGGKAVQDKTLTDRLTIPVRKYDAEVFRMLIQFVHSGIVTINDKNVCGLLCGAVQFQLTDLAHACWIYISDCLSSASCGVVLLEPARFYSKHHSAARDVVDKIHSALEDRHISKFRMESTV